MVLPVFVILVFSFFVGVKLLERKPSEGVYVVHADYDKIDDEVVTKMWRGHLEQQGYVFACQSGEQHMTLPDGKTFKTDVKC